jgi:hypothetical protein
MQLRRSCGGGKRNLMRWDVFIIFGSARVRTPLADYRCFFLDDEGHIVARQEYEARDDAAALEIARAFKAQRTPPRHGFELWEGGLFVHIESEPSPLGLD